MLYNSIHVGSPICLPCTFIQITRSSSSSFLDLQLNDQTTTVCQVPDQRKQIYSRELLPPHGKLGLHRMSRKEPRRPHALLELRRPNMFRLPPHKRRTLVQLFPRTPLTTIHPSSTTKSHSPSSLVRKVSSAYKRGANHGACGRLLVWAGAETRG